MSDHRPRPPHDPTPQGTALRRLRVAKGTTIVVRTLSTNYKGLFVHWHQGLNRYCPGADKCDIHALEKTWKGYCCVESWSQAANLWIPEVLEITESLELDFRGRFGPGQVWELTHTPPAKKKKGGGVVNGVFWEQLKEGSVPEPYDMRPVLYLTYHRMDIVLQHDNPLPARVVVQPSRGAAPRRPGQTVQTATPEQFQRFREATAGMFGMPEETANGAPRRPQ